MLEQRMVPQRFAVIGKDDHERVIEDAAASQLVEQDAQLIVEVRDAIVVRVAARFQ